MRNMKFLTFVEIDLRKVIPFLLGVFAVAIIGFQGLFFKLVSNTKTELMNNAGQSGVSLDEYLKTVEPISLTGIIDSNPYPILLMIFIGLACILFGFYVWYKEWFGASKRIYTLLSIKGSRFRIFMSKLTVFLFIFMSFYGVVLLCLFISGVQMRFMLPEQAVANHLVQNFILHSQMISYILPIGLNNLIYQLAFIVMIFTILSVFVLLDRSKKVWGMITGLFYVIGSMVLFFYMSRLDLYTNERVLVDWAFTGFFLIVSTAISYYLLKKKVSI